MLRRWFYLVAVLFLGTGVISSFAIDEVRDIPGQIGIIGVDYNIYTYDTAREDLHTLTDDASPSRHYQWLTWSSDGRLAYFCCEGRADGQAYISRDGRATPELAYDNPGRNIIFAYWSPAGCGDNCRDLAMLVNSQDGLSVDILTDADERSTTLVGTGAPYYFHWNSTGTEMIFHRGNHDLDIYSRTQSDITASLANSSGLFQTPIWSPIDDRILVALPGDSNGTSNLAIIEGDNVTILADGLLGLLSFLWSPDARYIAYRTIDQFGYSGLTVIDATNGEAMDLAENEGVIAFFWSPDSTKIAYLALDLGGDDAETESTMMPVAQTFVQNDSPPQLIWHILDIESQSKLRYSSFNPTYEMIYLLTYFDQFAPGHRLWSPDSNYLVFAGGLDPDQAVPMVYMLNIEEPETEPEGIADGVYGIWSFE